MPDTASNTALTDMQRVVVFDFCRTLYDPDTERLIPGAKRVLGALVKRGFVLCVVTRAKSSRRSLIYKFGIRKFFSRIVVSPEKSERDFERIFRNKHFERYSSFVVGDRVRQEIFYGNRLGLQTIWLRHGKFADELPVDAREEPTYIIGQLKNILNVVY